MNTATATPAVFAWAQSLGLFLFPIRQGWKSPAGIVKSWPEASSNDPRRWSAWHAQNPGCNWGVDLGKSGYFVVDVDTSKVGRDAAWQAACEWWLKNGGGALVSALIVGTPTGGFHPYFRNDDRSVRNRVLIPGVLDIRGAGGYVVAPFSATSRAAGDQHVKADGAYQFISVGAPAVATDAVVAALRPVERVNVERPAADVAPRASREFVRQAAFALSDFDRRLGWLAEAGEGERNRTLHHVAVEGWKFAAAGLLDPADVETWLVEAAAECGLDGQEVPKTIRSASDMVARGAVDPLDLPPPERTAAAIFGGGGDLSGLPGEIPFQVPEVLGYLARKGMALVQGKADGLPGRARSLCLNGARACNLGIPENIVVATLWDAYRAAKLDGSALSVDWKEAKRSRAAMQKDLLLRMVKSELGEEYGTVASEELSLQELMSKEIKGYVQIVPGFLPRGSAIWLGKPKAGKGWNTLKLALMTSIGGMFCGLRCTKCAVLYYSLEENSETIALRTAAIKGGEADPSAFDKADMTVIAADHRPANADRGGLERVRNWVSDPCRAGKELLVIIDTFGKFKSKRRASGDAYENAEAAMTPIARLADEFPMLTVVITHHVRKQTNESDDITDLASGGNSIAGGVDTIVHNAFDEETGLIELKSVGRKQSGTFTLLGAKSDSGIRPRTAEDEEAGAVATEAGLRGGDRAILQVLRDAGPSEALSLSAVTDRVGGKRSTVYRSLNRLIKSGFAELRKGGGFAVKDPDGPREVDRPTAAAAKPAADFAGMMAPPTGLAPVQPTVAGRDRAALTGADIFGAVPPTPPATPDPIADARAAAERLQADQQCRKEGRPGRSTLVVGWDLDTLAKAAPDAAEAWRQALAPLLAAPPVAPPWVTGSRPN